MNGEKPKYKPWKDIVEETKDSIKYMEQNLEIIGWTMHTK